jgi:hypothetical protein
MRRIRSESCTFIWHPKVLMQAVLPPLVVATVPPSAGLRDNGIGAVGASLAVLFILFLRLVDAGCDGDLTRTAPEREIFDLEIPCKSRPP